MKTHVSSEYICARLRDSLKARYPFQTPLPTPENDYLSVCSDFLEKRCHAGVFENSLTAELWRNTLKPPEIGENPAALIRHQAF
ncbi:hypothetical protein [Shimia gijangensis]|uniref:hypothetical protein n=1 Tax=Shimia gijangensis TaxID=1470563 RepID=UPI001114E7D7|nr:hypothetical protein [Shimia gijangensis]